MRYLVSILLLLSFNVFASDYDICLESAKKGYDRCMQRFERLGEISASVCEDPYIQNVAKCKPDAEDARDVEKCVSICFSGLKRCLAHHSRYNNADICEDSYFECLQRCENH